MQFRSLAHNVCIAAVPFEFSLCGVGLKGMDSNALLAVFFTFKHQKKWNVKENVKERGFVKAS